MMRDRGAMTHSPPLRNGKIGAIQYQCPRAVGSSRGRGTATLEVEMHPQFTPRRRSVPRICERCGADFLVDRNTVESGGGRFCSVPCVRSARSHLDAVAARFWSKVDQSGDCWLWTASTSDSGYGRLRLGAFFGHRMAQAHRFALEQRLGRPLAPGMFSLHTCDNPPCVRNDGDEGIYEVNGIVRIRFGHLWEGTILDNSADMTAKGRGPCGDRNGSRLYPERLAPKRGAENGMNTHPERRARGEQQGSAKLTDALVRDIRTLVAGGMPYTQVADKVGVSRSQVGRVILRQCWGHVE